MVMGFWEALFSQPMLTIEYASPYDEKIKQLKVQILQEFLDDKSIKVEIHLMFLPKMRVDTSF